MRRQLSTVVIATLVFSTPAFAQADWVRELLLAAELPIIALDARREGVSGNDIGTILAAVRSARLPAREAKDILDSARVIHREYGPTDNFGAFVQSQLAAGKRGRDLSAAIRAEHARMGKGRGNAKAPGADDANRGRGNATPSRGRGDDTARGRSDAARGRGNAGKPPEGNRGRGGPPSR
ncbi:MAG TPA: hypothetical protein VFO55_08440 [Gemmatimonadaceae bacterium]|nr:hypothetical protein [Gemmatimonadaceae bacterium]